MKIRSVCEKTGLTDRTVRYYIEEGLINPDYTENYLGRRTFDFSDSNISELNHIATLRAFGFSIEEIKEIISNPAHSQSVIQRVKDRARENIVENNKKLTALSALNSEINYTISELAEELSSPNEISKANETVEVNIRKKIAKFLKTTAVFSAVWLPVLITVSVLAVRILMYKYSAVNPLAIVLTALSLVPSGIVLLLSALKGSTNQLAKQTILVLCAICIPLSFMFSLEIITECEHSWSDFITLKQAECSEEGKIVRKCKKCNKTDTATIGFLPHTEEVDKGKAPTCTQTGLTEGKHCSVCQTILLAQEKIPKSEHTYGEWRISVEATCTEDGECVRVCECGQRETGVISATGHTMGAWLVGKAASCKEEGILVRLCYNCQAEEYDTTGKSDKHVVVIDEAVAPTCSAYGKTEGSHCSVCSKVFVEQTAVPITNEHTPVTDLAVPPTCKDTGLTEGSHCSVCGKVFEAQLPIPLSEHQYTDNLCTCGTYKYSEGLAFTKSGSIYILSGIGDCTDPRIVVPDTYNGAPVTKIADDAFKSTNSFYEIILPPSITDIGNRAFSGCKELKTITIPSGVTRLLRETFSGCAALEEVILSDNVIMILESCFASCTSLKKITLSKNLMHIRENAFYNCSSLETISLPSSLTEIQQYAFRDCKSLHFKYLGMKWQFKKIRKGFEWSQNTASCLVKCYDGEFDIYFD